MILKVKDENGHFKEVVLKGLKGEKGDRGEDGTVLQQKEIDDIKSSLDNMAYNVTPEMLKKETDIDDTNSIQLAIEYCAENRCSLVLKGNYYTSSKILLHDQINVYGLGSKITYSGSDSAVCIYKYLNSATVKFGDIEARNGNCLELYGRAWNEYIQYLNLEWENLYALDKCIFCHAVNGSWVNEIRFNNGRFIEGNYGVYADAGGGLNLSGYVFTNIGIEGVNLGFYVANQRHTCWYMSTLRYAEAKKVLKTVGQVEFITINTNSVLGDVALDFSNETNNVLIYGITADGEGYSFHTGGIAYVSKGKIYNMFEKPQEKNLYNVDLYDCRERTQGRYIRFGVGGKETTIILSEAYKNNYSESFFYVYDGSGLTTIIKDNNENIIYKGVIGYNKTAKFEWDGKKWYMSMLQSSPIET